MTRLPLADRLDDLFETLCALRPIDSTFLGRHDRDADLPDFSPDGIALQRSELDRLAAAFPPDDTPEPAGPREWDR